MTDRRLWFQVQLNSFSLLKPDCHSRWISKMQYGCEEEQYAINFCLKLGKNATETHGMLQTSFWKSCMDRASVFSGIRDSRKAGSLREMMIGVGGVKKTIHQSWLAKRLELGLPYWGFKRVLEDIPSEEASTLPIRPVAFPPGQYTSPQLNPCQRLFDQVRHQDSSSASF